MPLHLIKLSVGTDSVADLEDWIKLKLKEKKRRGQKPERVHTTRMVPKRAEELTAGGSLFWVIKGVVGCRQPILDVKTLGEGKTSRCEITLEPRVIRTAPQARRPFQGWRYLEGKDAPTDLTTVEATDLPGDLVQELRELGAW